MEETIMNRAGLLIFIIGISGILLDRISGNPLVYLVWKVILIFIGSVMYLWSYGE